MWVAEDRKEPHIKAQHQGKYYRKYKLLCIRLIVHCRSNGRINGAIDQIAQDKIYEERSDQQAPGYGQYLLGIGRHPIVEPGYSGYPAHGFERQLRASKGRLQIDPEQKDGKEQQYRGRSDRNLKLGDSSK